MSIDHLKKQAKALKQSLPEFVGQYPDGKAPLSAFQELVARASGYPSWHAAVHRRDHGSPLNRGQAHGIAFEINVERDTFDVIEYTKSGQEKVPRPVDGIVFAVRNQDRLDEVTKALDDFLDQMGRSDEFEDGTPPPAHSRELALLCKKLVAKDPSFIDGYAHFAIAQFWLGQHATTIEVCLPVFEHLCSLVPAGPKTRVPYIHLENRPFHRLAHGLVLAHYGLKTVEGDTRALKIVKTMLKWWPNDNIGFRFLLERPEDEE